MREFELTVAEEALHDLLVAGMLSEDKSCLLGVFKENVIDMPRKEVYLKALRTMAMRGTTEAKFSHVYLFNINSFSKSSIQISDAAGEFHEYMVLNLAINAEDLALIHPTITPYFLRNVGQQIFIEAIRNSSPSQVKTWLGSICPAVTSEARADTRASVSGLLLFSDCYSLISSVQSKVPNWGQVLDHRQRNVLFYARDGRQLETALEAKASSTQKDKNGLTVTEWWSIATTPAVSTLLMAAYTDFAAEEVSIEDVMVNKLLRLGFSELTQEERQAFDKAFSNPSWTWEGTLEGVKGKWTLEDVWKFGELAVINRHSRPLNSDLDRKISFGSGSARNQREGLPVFLKNSRKQLPADFLGRLKKCHFDRPLSLALDFLGMTLEKESEVESRRRIQYVNEYQESEMDLIYGEMVFKFMARCDEQVQSRLIEGLEIFRDAKWAWDPVLFKPIMETICGRVSEEKTNVKMKPWAEYYLSVPMKHSFHHINLHQILAKKIQNDYPVVESDERMSLLTQVEIKALGAIGMDHVPTVAYPSTMENLSERVNNGALDGVSIPKRWLKHLSPETQVCVKRAILANKSKAVRENLGEYDQATEVSLSRPKM